MPKLLLQVAMGMGPGQREVLFQRPHQLPVVREQLPQRGQLLLGPRHKVPTVGIESVAERRLVTHRLIQTEMFGQ